MNYVYSVFFVLFSPSVAYGFVGSAGISYMDPLNTKALNNWYKPGEDPCNPLYWYPRQIPEYCLFKIAATSERPMSSTTSVPPKKLLIPPPLTPILPPIIPLPPPILPVPPILPPPLFPNPIIPISPPAMMPSPQIIPFISMSPYALPAPSISYGIQPTNSMFGLPQRNRIGMVPGIPGIVSKDGGINIMPFSDAYSDILEEHKNKMIRRKLKRILDKYDKKYMYDY